MHPAPAKAVARMREKLREYAPPHPKGVWPLAANILDPVPPPHPTPPHPTPPHPPAMSAAAVSWVVNSERRSLGLRAGEAPAPLLEEQRDRNIAPRMPASDPASA